jgi:uncharacterized membrane protein YgcG
MNNLTPELMAQMAQMLAANQQPQAATQGFAPQTMQPQQPENGITGCSIPVKINSPLGSVKVNIHLGADVVTPMGLQMAMQQLQAMGFQIDAWQPKPQGFGGSSQGGSFNRGGGGFGGNSGGRW